MKRQSLLLLAGVFAYSALGTCFSYADDGELRDHTVEASAIAWSPSLTCEKACEQASRRAQKNAQKICKEDGNTEATDFLGGSCGIEPGLITCKGTVELSFNCN